MSLLAASGTIDWSKAILPAGRSKSACQQMLWAAKHQAGHVIMSDGTSSATTPKTKKGTKAASEGSKRKRGPKSQVIIESKDDEEEEVGVKKQKMESDEDADDQIHLELIEALAKGEDDFEEV